MVVCLAGRGDFIKGLNAYKNSPVLDIKMAKNL